MSMAIFCLLIICGIVYPRFVTSVSITNATEKLLQKYEFLPSSLQEYGRSATDEEVTQAIKDVQYMAGLLETGLLNDDTQGKIEGRRCGNVDNVDEFRNEASRQEHVGLRKRSLSWAILRYSSNPILAHSFAIKKAFQFWQDISELTFSQTIGEHPQLLTSDIHIYFHPSLHEDSAAFDGKGGVLAHFLHLEEVNRAEIHFDESEDWNLDVTLPSESGVSLLAVAVHQIGHALGLAHTTNNASVMYPWYSENATRLTPLSSEETLLLADLYDQEAVDSAVEAVDKYDLDMSPAANESMKCPDSVDAVVEARNNIFYFKGDVFWSFNYRRDLEDVAVTIHGLWYGLPPNLTHIDAVYSNQKSGQSKVVIFVGNKYFSLTTNRVPESTPETGRPIADFCLPSAVKKIDAAFVWGHNGHTYIISGNMYWRLEDELSKQSCDSASSEYPKDMRVWKGVRLPVDAAETVDGVLYFYHKEHYWKFDDDKMEIDESSRSIIASKMCFSADVEQENTTTTVPNNMSAHLPAWHIIAIHVLNMLLLTI